MACARLYPGITIMARGPRDSGAGGGGVSVGGGGNSGLLHRPVERQSYVVAGARKLNQVKHSAVIHSRTTPLSCQHLIKPENNE